MRVSSTEPADGAADGFGAEAYAEAELPSRRHSAEHGRSVYANLCELRSAAGDGRPGAFALLRDYERAAPARPLVERVAELGCGVHPAARRGRGRGGGADRGVGGAELRRQLRR